MYINLNNLLLRNSLNRRDINKQTLDYETTIHSLQDKLNLFNEEKQENNKTYS